MNYNTVDAISELDIFLMNLDISEEEKKKAIKAYNVLTKAVIRYENALQEIAFEPCPYPASTAADVLEFK